MADFLQPVKAARLAAWDGPLEIAAQGGVTQRRDDLPRDIHWRSRRRCRVDHALPIDIANPRCIAGRAAIQITALPIDLFNHLPRR
jgi:hypothetical protein